MAFEKTKRVVEDCMTSANGDFDPARVIGYGVVVIGALVFFGLTIYNTIINRTFDGGDFAAGLSSVSAAVVAAGAGVWLKKDTEIPYTPPENREAS